MALFPISLLTIPCKTELSSTLIPREKGKELAESCGGKGEGDKGSEHLKKEDGNMVRFKS